MRTKNIIIYIVICLIIIAGIAVWDSRGFNTELQYSSRYQIELSNKTGINEKDVEQIADEVLGNTRHFVQKVETFGNYVAIVSEQMSDEQKNSIVEKYNEKYNDNVKPEDVKIEYIPFTRVKDVIKHFIIPGIVATGIILVYFLIRFRKLGFWKILLKTIFYPVIAEIMMYSIMAIVRIPFGRLAIGLSIGLYVGIIFGITCMFEKEKSKLKTSKKEND